MSELAHHSSDVEVLNQNEVRVIGLSRSGNHAIINWMRQQMQGRTCFLNCTEGKRNPFETARPVDDGWVCQASYDDFSLEDEADGRLSPKDWLIFSHEDSFLGHACSDEFEIHHDEWVGPSTRRFDVLILRDPYNLMASRWRLGCTVNSDAVTLRIWKQHARQFLGRTDRLVGEPVLISYNRWCTEREYRQILAEQLGLEFTDRGKSQVTACAGGSSFDGLGFDGAADEMLVMERWKHFAHDPEFLTLFDDEIHELAEAVFGHIQPLDYLANEESESIV